jgi:tetratricopeptide (TPR) repeat protein
MWFYALFITTGVLCLLGMGAIVARKLPILSILNVDDLPEEQEAARKREIIQGRVARKAAEVGRRVAVKAGEQAAKAGAWMQATQAKLEAMQREMPRRVPPVVPPEVPTQPDQKPAAAPTSPKDRVVALLAEAEKFRRLGDAVNAEEKYVEAISWDAKDERAYRALAELYVTTRRSGQALETLDFLVKILRREYGCRHDVTGEGEKCGASAVGHADLAAVYVQAGTAAMAGGNPTVAADRLVMAALIMPLNPRYLGLLVEARIAAGDKPGAAEALEALRQASPDNAGIAQFHAKIEGLPEK